MSVRQNDEIAYLRPAAVTEWLKAMIPVGESLWIHGKPGIGKTDVVRQAAAALGYECPHFPPAVTLESVDVRGFGYVDREANLTKWAPPDFWPTDPDWRGIIFVDELPQAGKDVQSAFLQLCHGGRLGSYVKPAQAVFVVCGNRQQDKAGVNRVITPLLNRFCHVGMESNLEDWFAWAVQQDFIHPSVIAFLRFRGETSASDSTVKLFDAFDASVNQTAFATPRTWAKAGKIVRKGLLPDHLLQPTLTGVIGAGPAAEFVTFYRMQGKMPNPDLILQQPSKAAVPSEPAILFALCSALADRVRGSLDPKLLANFVEYADRLPSEYSVLAMRDGVAVNARLLPHAKNWYQKHKDVFAKGA